MVEVVIVFIAAAVSNGELFVTIVALELDSTTCCTQKRINTMSHNERRPKENLIVSLLDDNLPSMMS